MSAASKQSAPVVCHLIRLGPRSKQRTAKYTEGPRRRANQNTDINDGWGKRPETKSVVDSTRASGVRCPDTRTAFQIKLKNVPFSGAEFLRTGGQCHEEVSFAYRCPVVCGWYS